MKSRGSGLAKKQATRRKEKTNTKMTTDVEKSTTNAPLTNLWMIIYQERGGRTIEENGNQKYFDVVQVLNTTTLERLVFEGRHG